MTPFEPIAIVGQGCVLPGALTLEALWQAVAGNECLISPPPPGAFGLTDAEQAASRYVSGFVTGFDGVFDPKRVKVKGIDAARLDPVCAWPLHAALDAWKAAGKVAASPDRRGVFLANLSYPSRAKAAYAADIWTRGTSSRPPTDALNSGYPAHLLAAAIGATGPVLSLDAACASSLYALEIACRKLQSRQIDVALVGAVNAADNLILHIGFEALQALSPTGRSRPFIHGADGLVPAEGAAAVVLKRLCDVTPKDTVHGVIRAVGLSNDGRRKGLLAPDSTGQAEAMQQAYAASGLAPASVNFLECHATGTPVGDSVEIAAATSVFGTERALTIGSLKANTGHLITVAGLASLLKLTQAMANETLPPMPLDGDLIDALASPALRPLDAPAPWTRGKGPRRAAISNFGFGGNNAHLILDQHQPTTGAVQVALPEPEAPEDIVICGVDLMAGSDHGERDVLRRLMNHPVTPAKARETLGVDPRHARTPPNDLLQAEAQQLAVLAVTRAALAPVTRPAPERCGVFVGMGCAADSARWLLRERAAKAFGLTPGTPEHAEAQSGIAPPLQAATVLGAMANMTANRITSAEDFRGQGYAISAESNSGLAALDVACAALREGRLDMAVVAAADFATEPVATAALTEIDPAFRPGDAAAALVLKRRTDAEAAGDRILGVVGAVAWNAGALPCPLLASAYGTAPAAAALTELAASALLMARDQVITPDGAIPNLTGDLPHRTVATYPSPLANTASVTLAAAPAPPSPDPLRPPPHLYWAAGATQASLAKKLRSGKPGGKGRCRIALIAGHGDALARLTDTAARALDAGQAPTGPGVSYGEGAPDGELAFVFTGSAAVYPRMSRGLFMAFPEIGRQLSGMARATEMADLLTRSHLSEFEQLCAGTLVSQAHAILMRDILGVTPTAAIGLSLGESNALFAFGFWKDPGKLLDEIEDAAMYERHLGGDFETAQAAWGPNVPSDWANWHVQAPLDKVRAAVADHPNVEITIIYSDEDCLIGGPSAACRAVADALGPRAGAAMHQHLIVHAKAMKPFEDQWRKLHTRPVSRVPGIRLYANAINASYTPTKARVADMLTRQAVDTVDFPPTIRQAYEDGVRTFVELGPRDTLSRAIPSILGDKSHVAVATDRIEASDLGQIAHLTAVLFADGRPINIAAIAERLDAARENGWTGSDPMPLNKPAHYPTPVVPAGTTASALPPAPTLAAPCYPHSGTRPAVAAEAEMPAACPTKSVVPRKVVSGTQPLTRRNPRGPSWNRERIEASTRGRMSDFFGAPFAAQDAFDRQVRLPAPPLLLVDRITGIDADAGIESTGVIWTETDLTADDWHVRNDHVRPGPLIECGQADLTLIGWMGADLKNRDERVYRLLGCEITFHEGGLPGPGDTLGFQIEITGHATLAGVRMFFFQYDCRVGDRKVFSVRNGQAGFFTDEELATGKGVIWDATTHAAPTPSPHPFDTSRASLKRAFPAPDLAAFRAGDALACFGKGFEFCAAHSRPAHLPDGRLAFFDEITAFDPAGGPWGRGYLKARAHVPTDAWFYDGHFHKDPCMPGTLMAEAAVQALEFYAAAVGLTIERDGYVFEPMPGETAKFVCRGQVIPDRDHEVTYEVFIDDIVDGESPVLYASLLAKSDGKKVFHCPRFAIRLRKHWPAPYTSDTPLRVGPMGESRGDHAALLNCAASAPSAAFGDLYLPFDTAGRAPRLPQPPYHMMTRVTDVSTRPGVKETGARVVAEYDIPGDAWYFRDNPNGAMPFSVLSEIALQPCGWLASHCGFALESGERFRNLDGDGDVFMEVGPDDGTIIVETTLISFSKVGPMTIVGFDLKCVLADGRPIMNLKTQFGFFPAAALVRQAGLPTTDAHRHLRDLPSNGVHSTRHALTAGGQLRMIDEIDYFDADGGTEGLGLARGRQTVDPHAWYFKAHFFQDPVQPGSLGLDALVQLLCHAARLKGCADGMTAPRFETIAAAERVKWMYRGQVTPDKQTVTTVMEIVSITRQDSRTIITGRGSLWCDGLRIYEANPISVALSDGI
ncbi:beta-ketoacyl synthase N-terminal-like domain-containing protein [Hyphomonas johnsonii]|nr:beta-ketoacyl synthase N-terminal-like domain-containing protein [Hyphomonas johnsonii]